ncbi:hypothetical protein [uncultured Bacteroides sp.]|uniref:hypothetical protein n=1 Tax=uncultured Bacteroides sp. TaxID=162156 RepID=UPI00260D2D3B|nr:hypothetical protein [uncultured Bacteroides sp.]
MKFKKRICVPLFKLAKEVAYVERILFPSAKTCNMGRVNSRICISLFIILLNLNLYSTIRNHDVNLSIS